MFTENYNNLIAFTQKMTKLTRKFINIKMTPNEYGLKCFDLDKLVKDQFKEEEIKLIKKTIELARADDNWSEEIIINKLLK